MDLALIGFGYWGRNIARTCAEIGARLCWVWDIDPGRLQRAQAINPMMRPASLQDILASDVGGVLIATPPQTHYEIAKGCLEAGKHVFVEKPFTTRIEDAYDLLNISDRYGKLAFVDHTFLYAEPVKRLKQMVGAADFGEILYIASRRINLGLFQHAVDVIWDLAVHDLSIVDHLVGLDIARVSVFRKRLGSFPRDAFASINMELKSGTLVTIHVSWLSPVKIREMIIGGKDLMAVYDDTQVNKLRVYDQGVILDENLSRDALHQHLIQYKYGEAVEPTLPRTQSLTSSIKDFLECASTGKEPLSGRSSIMAVMKALEIIARTAI